MTDQFDVQDIEQITLKIWVKSNTLDTVYKMLVHPLTPVRDFLGTMIKIIVLTNTCQNQQLAQIDKIEIHFQNQIISPLENRTIMELEIKDQDAIYITIQYKKTLFYKQCGCLCEKHSYQL